MYFGTAQDTAQRRCMNYIISCTAPESRPNAGLEQEPFQNPKVLITDTPGKIPLRSHFSTVPQRFGFLVWKLVASEHRGPPPKVKVVVLHSVTGPPEAKITSKQKRCAQ